MLIAFNALPPGDAGNVPQTPPELEKEGYY